MDFIGQPRLTRYWCLSVAQGSENEVIAERLDETEGPVLIARRKRRDFRRPVHLDDTPADILWNAVEVRGLSARNLGDPRTGSDGVSTIQRERSDAV